MKVSGFAQLHNELSQGNLINWFKCMDAVCDNIFIYDQNSTDGSLEEYAKHPNTYVIQSPINDFSNEIACKAKLLRLLLEKSPDTNWIFWMDGDTILDRRSLVPGYFKNMLSNEWNNGTGVGVVGHYNLWRSDVHYRLDNYYHNLNQDGVYAIWRNTGKLYFPESGGLHLLQYPPGMAPVKRVGVSLIHRGFATDKSITRKYINYRSRGQSGYALDRLIDEKTLSVGELDKSELPDWFDFADIENPTVKQKLIELYREELK